MTTSKLRLSLSQKSFLQKLIDSDWIPSHIYFSEFGSRHGATKMIFTKPYTTSKLVGIINLGFYTSNDQPWINELRKLWIDSHL